MSVTKDHEKIGQNWVNKNYNVIREIPSRYYNFVVILPTYEEQISEASEEEFLRLPVETGVFSFLAEPEEDIYTDLDGSRIEG